jgi:thiamine biosynthesis lipoprotein
MQRVEHVMGMPVLVEVRESIDEVAVERVFDWFRWVDAVFSTYKDDSQVSRINRGELAPADAHPDVLTVFGLCEQLRALTDGYFDAHAVSPDVFDPSGLVKGWSVDRAASLLDASGAATYAINAGGDIRLRGGPWRVGVQHPTERGAIAKVLEATELAIATSGEYARGSHVVDPHTRRPPAGLLSVTVTGPDLATADGYATAAFAMGAERSTHWLARLRGYEAMSIRRDGSVLTTPGFPA